MLRYKLLQIVKKLHISISEVLQSFTKVRTKILIFLEDFCIFLFVILVFYGILTSKIVKYCKANIYMSCNQYIKGYV